MLNLPEMSVAAVVDLVNEFGSRPRAVAGEESHPYPTAPASGVGDSVPPESVVALADDLWSVFNAPDTDERASRLTALILSSGLRPAISPAGAMTWAVDDESSEASLRAATIGALAHTVTRLGWNRIGTCAAQDCVDVFVDDGNRAHRIYCSPTCLNRSRVRAYRQRES